MGIVGEQEPAPRLVRHPVHDQIEEIADLRHGFRLPLALVLLAALVVTLFPIFWIVMTAIKLLTD